MADLAIGAIGLVSLVSTIESCIIGYDKFILSAQRAAVSTETSRLALDIRIEQRKFDMYWKYTGLSRTDCPLLRAQSRSTQNLIVDVVNEIACLLSDSSKLASEYGFTITKDWDLHSTPTPGATNNALYNIYQSIWRYSMYNSAVSTLEQSNVSASRRLRWVWKDHAKAVELLEHLRRYNHELYTYLSPQHEFLLKLGEPSFLLPGFNDPDFLQALFKRSPHGPSDGPLASASELRRSLINYTNDDADQPLLPSLCIPAEDIWIIKDASSATNRDIGSYKGETVIIEYKYIDPTLTETQQTRARKRLNQLILLLSKQYHSDFHFLRAYGIYEDHRNRHRYGLVFKAFENTAIGNLKIHTLSSLFDSESATFSLGARIKLGLDLCISVMQLHAAGWLHKNITTENIIFTAIKDAEPNISEPRLTGFELARPDKPMEQSLDTQDDAHTQNLFLHPERHGLPPVRYRKKHDYYAVGMCLLCIGGWHSLKTLRQLFNAERPTTQRTPAIWTDFVIDYANRSLGQICGDVFRDAVVVCLSGNFPLPAASDEETADWNLQTAFYSVVVKKLAECHV